MSAYGFCIKNPDGTLDIRTCSETERAAIVNGLVIGGHMVLAVHSDAMIAKAWAKFAAIQGHRCVRVVLAEMTDA